MGTLGRGMVGGRRRLYIKAWGLEYEAQPHKF